MQRQNVCALSDSPRWRMAYFGKSRAARQLLRYVELREVSTRLKDTVELMVMQKQVVLVASRDPQQAVIRKNLLEQAGFQVHSALDRNQVEEACSGGRILGVVIGWSVAADEKRRVWTTVREVCGPNVPIVELLRGGNAELLPDRALFPQEWDEKRFAQTVAKIFKPN